MTKTEITIYAAVVWLLAELTKPIMSRLGNWLCDILQKNIKNIPSWLLLGAKKLPNYLTLFLLILGALSFNLHQYKKVAFKDFVNSQTINFFRNSDNKHLKFVVKQTSEFFYLIQLSSNPENIHSIKITITNEHGTFSIKYFEIVKPNLILFKTDPTGVFQSGRKLDITAEYLKSPSKNTTTYSIDGLKESLKGINSMDQILEAVRNFKYKKIEISK